MYICALKTVGEHDVLKGMNEKPVCSTGGIVQWKDIQSVYWEENMPNNERKLLREGAPQGWHIVRETRGKGICDSWSRSVGVRWSMGCRLFDSGLGCTQRHLSERSRNNAIYDEGACEPVTQEVTQRVAGMSHVKLWFQNWGESLNVLRKHFTLRAVGG